MYLPFKYIHAEHLEKGKKDKQVTLSLIKVKRIVQSSVGR